MLFIIMHHIISQVISSGFTNHFWACIDLPLHTAVIIFVLISGYYGIHFKTQKLIDLLLQIIYYSFILSFISIVFFQFGNNKHLVQSFFPFSNNFYWFVCIYLQLYLIAPFIEKGLNLLKRGEYTCWLLLLFFFTVYLGLLRKNTNFIDGKNIVEFIFIYSLGFGIRKFKWFFLKKKTIYLMFAFMLLIVCSMYFLPDKNNIFTHVMALCYTYNSPFLIYMAILLFIIAKYYTFTNKIIYRLHLSPST